MQRSAMATVTKVVVPARVRTDTLAAMQHFGDHHCEGFGLWLGTVEGQTATIRELHVPEQHSLRSESGVGYFLDGPGLIAIALYQRQHGLRLVAQVHSHPHEAYHSSTDDRYAIATEEGAFSLVLPDFGFCSREVTAWAVYRLNSGEWQRVSNVDVAKTFEISPTLHPED